MKEIKLLDGEKILKIERKHWKNCILPAIGIILAFAACMVRTEYPYHSLINMALGWHLVKSTIQVYITLTEVLIMVILMILLAAMIINILYIHYYVTDRRIISVYGLINRYYSEILIERCEMVYVNEKIWDRLFGCGDILCVGAGSKLLLEDVKDAMSFKQTILDNISKLKKQ